MVKYFWSESNGVDRPTLKYMAFKGDAEYYVGMPLKKVDDSTVEPTNGDPDYICMRDFSKTSDAAVLEIAVEEVFPDAVYERWNEDGSIDEVRFGGGNDWKDIGEEPTGGDTLYWDGNTEGLVSGDYYYLVSDAVPGLTDMPDIVDYSIGGDDGSIVHLSGIIYDFSDAIGIEYFVLVDNDGWPMVRFISQDFTVENTPIKKGIYFWKNPESNEYISSLTINGYTGFPLIKPVPEKYLPFRAAAAVADAAGSTPTADEFNALLASLRAAGLLKS